MLSFIFVNADSLQPMLIQQKFHIDKKDQFGNYKNTILLIFDIVVKIICAPLMGWICDKKGRKVILLYGLICISLSMSIMPFC